MLDRKPFRRPRNRVERLEPGRTKSLNAIDCVIDALERLFYFQGAAARTTREPPAFVVTGQGGRKTISCGRARSQGIAIFWKMKRRARAASSRPGRALRRKVAGSNSPGEATSAGTFVIADRHGCPEGDSFGGLNQWAGRPAAGFAMAGSPPIIRTIANQPESGRG